MKERYIALMEKALSAYTNAHICEYFDRVKTEGLTEHGFPRLTVNIGILIAHGRRRDLLRLFLEMMDFCCHSIPRVKAANDFSVREVVCCIMELERCDVVDAAAIARWKADLATIEPTSCYTRFATYPTQDIRNWALFTGVSEYFRQMIGLCDSRDFIDLQLASQLQFIDENGMYLDHQGTDVHQPIMYDIVARILFSLMLHFGYRGVHHVAIDDCLRRAGVHMLDMQSAAGEMAFGGRSNQFLHNEPSCTAVFEFEANRYAREGNHALAARFKAAIARALDLLEDWLSRDPILHIKNRFPTESKYGCEKYAYFDKYMITVASNLYVAYLMCDDGIAGEPASDPAFEPASVAWQTTYHFHKVFLRVGEYSAEYDTNADPAYDASGLGRIHRFGAPTAIALSVPCPSIPSYQVNTDSPMAFSICAGLVRDGEVKLTCDPDVLHEVTRTAHDGEEASASILCRLPSGEEISTEYTVTAEGVRMRAGGAEGRTVAYALPAFCMDGACSPEIRAEANALEISYEGWVCRYTTDGTVRDTGSVVRNRNGHYRVFLAEGREGEAVTVKVTIERGENN